MSEYIVDVTKPPIGPPNRTMKEVCFMLVETKESVQRNKDYHIYIEKYREELKELKKDFEINHVDDNGTIIWTRKEQEPVIEYDEDGWEILSKKDVEIHSIFNYKDHCNFRGYCYNKKFENKKVISFVGMVGYYLLIDDIPDYKSRFIKLIKKRKELSKRLIDHPNLNSSYSYKTSIDWNV